MSELKLKPCPFCGGKAELVSIGKVPNIKYTISCGTGGCMANISHCSSAENAINAWNKRV